MAAAIVGDLPEPKLGSDDDPYKRTADGKIECDGKVFKSYQGLVGYVRIRHPDRLEGLRAAHVAGRI